jgi:hypothetical protein
VQGYHALRGSRQEAAADRGRLRRRSDRSGGATKYGISLRFLAAAGAFDSDGDGIADFDLDMDGDIDGADVCKLTRAATRLSLPQAFLEAAGRDACRYRSAKCCLIRA